MNTDNIFLTAFPEVNSFIIEEATKFNIYVAKDYLETMHLVKDTKVKKIFLKEDVAYMKGDVCVTFRGQTAANEIHSVDPNILILIWNGRSFEYDKEDEFPDIPECMKLSGTLIPITYKNQIYADYKDTSDIKSLMIQFFNGSLNLNQLTHV